MWGVHIQPVTQDHVIERIVNGNYAVKLVLSGRLQCVISARAKPDRDLRAIAGELNRKLKVVQNRRGIRLVAHKTSAGWAVPDATKVEADRSHTISCELPRQINIEP